MPTFPQAEIDRKREMIKGSLRHQEEDPSFLAGRAFKKEVFGEHPYGRLIEGSADTLETITRDDLVKFYSEFFLPNNAILSIAGDLTSDELDSVMKKYLGAWKKADLPLIPRADYRREKGNEHYQNRQGPYTGEYHNGAPRHQQG